MFTVSSPFERLHSQPFLFPSWVFVTSFVLHILPYVLQSFLVRVIFPPSFVSLVSSWFSVASFVSCTLYFIELTFCSHLLCVLIFSILRQPFSFLDFCRLIFIYFMELMFCIHLQSVCYSPPPQPSFTAASFVSFCFIQTKTSLPFLICVNLLDAQLSLHLLVLYFFLCFSILQNQYFVVFAIHVNLLHSTPSSYLCELFFPFQFFFSSLTMVTIGILSSSFRLEESNGEKKKLEHMTKLKDKKIEALESRYT